MTQLTDKVKLALDETRLLVLGSQILLGFQFRSVLEARFEQLPPFSQYLKLLSLTCMLVVMLLLMWPACFQQCVEEGNVTKALHKFASRAMCWAMLPFGLALGMETFTVAQLVVGVHAALLVAVAAGAIALFYFYVWEWIAISRGCGAKERAMSKKQEQEPDKPTDLFDRVDHILTECRVVIPGAQALLGFQFIAMLTEGFEKLPQSSKYVHLAALLLIAVATVLLMTPAAYHRIVNRGESSMEFWGHARRMLLSGMFFLALGLSGETYIVSAKIIGVRGPALGISIGSLAVFYMAWFGYPLWKRMHRHGRASQRPAIAATAVAH